MFLIEGWHTILRTGIACLLTYAALVIILRVSGKRTLSKMTGFDMIIPLTLGPIVADMILLSNVTFVRGVMALVMLISLHSLVSWLSVRSARFRRIVKREPTLLLYRGQFMQEAMRRERVAEEEVRVAIRASGFAVVEKVEAVVLEADGSFNVVAPSTDQVSSSLKNVYGYRLQHLPT